VFEPGGTCEKEGFPRPLPLLADEEDSLEHLERLQAAEDVAVLAGFFFWLRDERWSSRLVFRIRRTFWTRGFWSFFSQASPLEIGRPS
jgi:hypothetical protein